MHSHSAAATAVLFVHVFMGQWGEVILPGSPGRVVAPGHSTDLYFCEAVEDWCVSAAIDPLNRRGRVTLAANVGDRGARLVKMLGCRESACRATAAECIAADATRDLDSRASTFRSLVWGMRSADPHVRNEARRLVERLFYPCAACDGSGGYADRTGWVACVACEGKGIYHH